MRGAVLGLARDGSLLHVARMLSPNPPDSRSIPSGCHVAASSCCRAHLGCSGTGTRLPERQRELLWSVFSKVAAALNEHGLLTEPRLFGRLERQIAKMACPPFEFCVFDEAQDIGVAEFALSGRRRRRAPGRPVLRRRPRSKDLPDAVLLASLGGRHPRALARLRCGSTTAPPIRSGGRRTGCCRPADRRPVESTPASWLHRLTVRSAHMVQPIAPRCSELGSHSRRIASRRSDATVQHLGSALERVIGSREYCGAVWH